MLLRYSLMPLLCLMPIAASAATTRPSPQDQEDKLTSDEWTLVPGIEEQELAVEGSLVFKVIRTKCYEYDGGLALCYFSRPTADELKAVTIEWQANGIPLGSAQVGTIRSYAAEVGRTPTPGGEMERVIYTAPATIPPGNPVAIAAVISAKGRAGQEQLLRHVRIVDTPGWRGNIQVNLFYSVDAEEVQDRLIGRHPVFELELPITDADRPLDHTVIESNLNFTVRGVLAEATNDDGSGLVVLQLQPSGTMNYYYRYQAECDHKFHSAQGEMADVYSAVPLNVNLELHADGTSTIQYIPGVAFAMHGVRKEEVCSDSSRGRYDGFLEPYEDFFEGTTITSGLVYTGEGSGPANAVFRGIDGDSNKHGKARSYTGAIKVPTTIHYAGNDYAAEAEITWSLSRK